MLIQSTINKVILFGKIVKEPHWQYEPGEKAFCFTVVTAEKVRKNADFVVHEEYHNIRVNSDLTVDTKYLQGQLVYIQGKIQTRQFVTEDQIRRYKTEVVALSVETLNSL